jgi:hypothetical protein
MLFWWVPKQHTYPMAAQTLSNLALKLESLQQETILFIRLNMQNTSCYQFSKKYDDEFNRKVNLRRL